MTLPNLPRKAKLAIILAIVIMGVGSLGLYSGWFQKAPAPVEVPAKTTPAPETPAPTTVPYKVEEVARGLAVPWAIVFTSPSRMLVTERAGTVRVIEGGVLQSTPLVKFSEAATGGEEGLMGLAKDPEYATNKYLYACLATESGGKMHDKVIRFKDQPGGGNHTEILGNIPAAQYHAGCRLAFGPDQKLYITTGDATNRAIAQDKSSLGGKILRLNPDGTVPGDNPFKGSPIWSFGHRNPQGLDWQPGTTALIATEHGPSGFDGPGGGDEVNFIEKGKNYGWPLVSHSQTRPGSIAPLVVFTPAVAPASGHFYTSKVIPQFTGNYFFGMLKGEGIYRIVFDKNDAQKIISREKVPEVHVGRVRDVTEGHDGAIYFSTSNRDGRGSPRGGDDKIYRIIPE